MGLFFSKILSKDDDPAPAATVVLPITLTRIKISGIWCNVSEPSENPKGLTFLIPGAMLSEASYMSTRNVLHAQRQIVISFYVNVFTKSHDEYAAAVSRIFHSFCRDKYNFKFFSIVGHSVGAKIGLMVVATNNDDSSSTISSSLDTLVALDPVDDHPPEFTNTDESKNRPLVQKQQNARNILVTFANATPVSAIPPAHNAQSIVAQSQGTIKLYIHENAAHMCYTDNGGGIIFGWIMRGGTKEGNESAKEAAHNLIRKYIGHT